MMDNLILRVERPEDHAAIYALTAAAFADMPYAGGDEQDVVNRLRDAGALHLSLVAVLDDKLVGQATFSPAENADGSGPWYALGPISVDPALQGRGIGGRLINAGIAQLKPALGCILTGNPDYYQRFGYEAAPDTPPRTSLLSTSW